MYLWRGGGGYALDNFGCCRWRAFRRTDAVDGVSRGGEKSVLRHELILLVGRIRR